MRGVNLGGWPVLEKWMTPGVFEGLEAVDQTTYCVELRDNADQAFKKHWDTFTHEDFVWPANVGINAVRIPIGYWIFGADYPYHAGYGEYTHPFVQGGIAVLDRAFDWAEELGLHVCWICTPRPVAQTALITAASRMFANGIPSRYVSVLLVR